MFVCVYTLSQKKLTAYFWEDKLIILKNES